MVREPEDLQERAESPIRGAGLLKAGGELLDAEPVGLAIGLRDRATRFARRLQLGHLIAPGLHLGLGPLSPLVRRTDSALEFGHAALEFGPCRRRGRGALSRGGRLGEAVLQVVPQFLEAPAVFSPFLLSIAPQPVELGLQLASPFGQFLVAPGHRRELVAVLLDHPGEPVHLGLLAGRLAAGGLGLLEEDGQAIPVRAQGLELPEPDIPLPDQGLDPDSEPLGFLADEGQFPLELVAGGFESLLPAPIRLVPLLGGLPLDLEDPGAESLSFVHARPKGGLEAIPLAADRLPFVGQPGEPKPIRLAIRELGAESVSLGADILQFSCRRFDPREIDPRELVPGGHEFGPQVPLEVNGIAQLASQLRGLASQPIVLRPDSSQFIPQSLRLPERALKSVELLLEVPQPAVGLGELVPRLGELPEGVVISGRLGRSLGVTYPGFTPSRRLATSFRVGRGRSAGFLGGRLRGCGDRAGILAGSGAETLAAMLAVDLATEVGLPNPQVAPAAMGACDPEMP
jgi:hypothetical protein